MERCRKRLIELSGTGKHAPARSSEKFSDDLKTPPQQGFAPHCRTNGNPPQIRCNPQRSQQSKTPPHNKRRLKPFSLFQTTPYKERPFQTTLNVV
ncbi:hypothetical protein [Neisseria mucosa]|uniref:hypothetical protein n=1 Tax=Neisseria mucosa TaxID=488 RepID=UPI00280AABF6|nr:hypothetical protein [Neisseria mucosa]